MRLIDADALYKAMQDAEELARRRVLDTESTLPYPTNLNPAYTRYLAQMDERTKAKEMVADAPTVDAVPAGAYRQVKWERDIAVGQLEKLGYELGEKVTPIVRCKDCIYGEKDNGGSWWCLNLEFLMADGGEGFCSYGKRKDGDEHG